MNDFYEILKNNLFIGSVYPCLSALPPHPPTPAQCDNRMFYSTLRKLFYSIAKYIFTAYFP